MSSSLIPLLGTETLATFFSKLRVVQDYPSKYGQEKPRKRDVSYSKALSEGMLYGIRTDSEGKHYTKIVTLAPSETLIALWSDTMGKAGAGNIESIAVRQNRINEPYVVVASYMSGIGSKVLGYITEEEYSKITSFVQQANISDELLP